MTIKQKLWFALSALALIILGIGLLAKSSFNKLEKQTTIYSNIAAADNAMFRARLSQADYLLLKEAEFKQQFDQNLSAAQTSLETTQAIMQVQSSIDRVNQIKAAIIRYNEEFTVIASTTQPLTRAAMLALFEAADEAASATEALLFEESVIVEQTRKSAIRNVMISVGIALIMCFGIARWLMNSIMHPLTASMQIMETIANGDLSQEQSINGNDEFASLVKASNKSTAKLRDVIGQIKSGLDNLDVAGKSVAKAVVESNDSMQKQKDDTTVLASSTMQVAHSSENIVASVQQASKKSTQAADEALKGNQTITNASEAMLTLSNELAKASDSVNKLNHDSANVAGILDVIRSIAEQTNLLALNAAIEAARAGEQGRGFAVVADEVRTLAGRTQNSIEEITTIIELIQTGAGDVVEAITATNNQSAKVIELNSEASDTYSIIMRNAEDIAQINNRVSDEADEQRLATQKTTSNITSITDLADLNAESLNAITKQIELQNQERNDLKQLIGFFKI